jgi:hypothetical protein
MHRGHKANQRPRGTVVACIAKLKHLMRKAAERTVEMTWKRIGKLVNGFKPDEYQRYLTNAGYAST